MAYEKATGIVIRTSDWSETSRVATFFTREFGKIRALAKGGRRLKSNFEVALDLLTVCNIVVIRKHSDGLDLLTEARVEERFAGLRSNLPALYAGYYIAELLGEGTQDSDPHPDLYDAALAALRDLNAAADVSPRIMRFELVWLHELGYRPRFDACAVCGAESPSTPRGWAFSPAAGGLLCVKCESAPRDKRPVSPGALEKLRELDEPGRAATSIGPLLRAELRQLLGQNVSYVLGRRPKLLGYLE